MKAIALTGEGGGRLSVPSRSTPMIQQAHLCLYHYLCQSIETELAGTGNRETTSHIAG